MVAGGVSGAGIGFSCWGGGGFCGLFHNCKVLWKSLSAKTGCFSRPPSVFKKILQRLNWLILILQYVAEQQNLVRAHYFEHKDVLNL